MSASVSDRLDACFTSTSHPLEASSRNKKDITVLTSSFLPSFVLKRRCGPLPLQIQGKPPWQVMATVRYPTSMSWWKNGEKLSNMHEISSSEQFFNALHEAAQHDKLVVVDFYSTGCRSCKALYPKVFQLAAEIPSIEILTVNFHENLSFCRSLKVAVLPFFHFYRGSEGRVDRFSCSLSKIGKLRAAVAKYQGDQHLLEKIATSPYIEQQKDLVVLPMLASAGAAA